MSKCGQGSKIKQPHHPLLLDGEAFVSRLVEPISWLEGEKWREHAFFQKILLCMNNGNCPTATTHCAP